MVRQILASNRLTSRSVFAGGTVPSTIQCIRLQRASFTVASGILGLQGEMKRMPDPRRPVIRLILFVGSLVWACGASAQTPRIELGLQLSGIRNGVLREYPLGGGGRITVHVFRFLDAEAEVNRFPIGGAISNYPATQVLAGTRLGKRFGPLGIYGKVRPGFMRFDENLYIRGLGMRPALDIGGVIEFYSRHYVAGRLDFGDTAVWYGNDTIVPPISGTGGNVVPNTRHQLQWSVGFSIWF